MTDTELSELARQYAARAIEVLAEILDDPDASADARAHAAIELLDRSGRHAPAPTDLPTDDFPALDPAIIDRLLN